MNDRQVLHFTRFARFPCKPVDQSLVLSATSLRGEKLPVEPPPLLIAHPGDGSVPPLLLAAPADPECRSLPSEGSLVGCYLGIPPDRVQCVTARVFHEVVFYPSSYDLTGGIGIILRFVECQDHCRYRAFHRAFAELAASTMP
jgi:hypothetical protein